MAKILTEEERHSAMRGFAPGLDNWAEPTAVFTALKRTCLQRQRSLKSASSLAEDELTVLRDIVAEGEAALAAVKSLIREPDQTARLAATLRLKHQHRQNRMRWEMQGRKGAK